MTATGTGALRDQEINCTMLLITPEIREAARQRILQKPGWQKMIGEGNPNLADITSGLVLSVVIDALSECQPEGHHP